MATGRFVMAGLSIAAIGLPIRGQAVPKECFDFVAVTPGQLPIVLSAPHGGQDKIPGAVARSNKAAYRFTTGCDVNTDVLVEALAKELHNLLGRRPFVVRAKFHRRYVDVNRRPEDAYESPEAKRAYDAYHAALAEQCTIVRRQWGQGLLLDIHGQVSRVDTVVRGTNDGKTDALLRQRHGEGAHFGPQSLIGRLSEAGLKVHPQRADEKELAGFRGGYIVQTYGSHERFAIDAVQLEFGSDYRKDKAVNETAVKTARAVEKFARQYLLIRDS